MNDIETLKKLIEHQFPRADISLKKREQPCLIWFLETSTANRGAIVVWSPSSGFSLYDSTSIGWDALYHEPEEICFDLETAFRFVIRCLLGS